MDFGVIIALLMLNATVGFWQEWQAGNIVDELKKTLAHKAVALRRSELIEIEVPEIVPGDIIHLEEVNALCPKGLNQSLTNLTLGANHPGRWPHRDRRRLPPSRSIVNHR